MSSDEHVLAPIIDEVVEIQRRLDYVIVPLGAFLVDAASHGVTDHERIALGELRLGLQSLGEVAATAANIELESFAERGRVVTIDPDITEDEMFGMLLRFSERRLGMPITIADLEQHLRKNGAVLPGEPRKSSQTLYEWCDEIEAIINERRREEGGAQVRFVEHPDKRNTYVFAEVVGTGTAAPKTVAPPAVVKEASPVPQSADTLDFTPSTEQMTAAALDLISKNPKDSLSNHYENLKVQFGLADREPAREIFRELEQAGHIHRVGDNRRRFRLGAAEVQNGMTADNDRQKLSKRQVLVAGHVVDALVELRERSKMLSATEIANKVYSSAADIEPFSVDDVKQIVRQLARQGIVENVKSREGQKRSRAKRAEVLKTRLSSQQIKTTWKSPKGRAYMIGLLTSGEGFDDSLLS